MPFSDVRHQERGLSILRRALSSGRTHHAYLFEGPEGVGKEMTARALAARLLCQDESLKPDADACGACRPCHLLATGNHPDFHLIHRGLHKLHPDRAVRASKGLYLAVDVIRTFLIEPAGNKPALGGRRVFLIREAERMNEGAQNALLKTLEEPPGETGLILVTASAERLLPTIRSRCQRIPFGLLPPAFVQEQLAAQLGLDTPAAETLARLADGRLGAALRWHRIGLLESLEEVGALLDRRTHDDPESFGKALVEIAGTLATRGMQSAAPDGDELADLDDQNNSSRPGSKSIPTDELRTALKLTFMLVAAFHRDALVAGIGEQTTRHLPQHRQRTAAIARQCSLDMLDGCVRAVAHAERMLDQNVAPQLVCERLATALSGDAPVR